MAEVERGQSGELKYKTPALAAALLAELREKGTTWLGEAAVTDLREGDAGVRVRARLAAERPVSAERHLLLNNFPDLLVVAAQDQEVLVALEIDDPTLRAGLIRGAEAIGSDAHLRNLIGSLAGTLDPESQRNNGDLHLRMWRFQKALIARWGEPLSPRVVRAVDLIPPTG